MVDVVVRSSSLIRHQRPLNTDHYTASFMASFLFSFIWATENPATLEEIELLGYLRIDAANEADALAWGNEVAGQFVAEVEGREINWLELWGPGKILRQDPEYLPRYELQSVQRGELPNFEVWKHYRDEILHGARAASREQRQDTDKFVKRVFLVGIMVGVISAIHWLYTKRYNRVLH